MGISRRSERTGGIGAGGLATVAALTVLLSLLALAAGPGAPAPKDSKPLPDLAAPTATGWVDIDYGSLVDRRRISHSGQSVGALLAHLEGRPRPSTGERPEDAAIHRVLDPLLEPYGFVLPDAMDSLEKAPEPPMVEVGSLWVPGGAEPAWAELLRARRYVVESDGAGKMRIFAPWPGRPAGSEEPAPGAAAREAWDQAWPVLRHALASERRRLAARAGDAPERHPIAVEVHAYVPMPERTRFRLGFDAYRVRVEDTRARPGRRPLDLAAWQTFLDRGLSLEGGRLDSDGNVRLLGSPTRRPQTLLGRPLTLSDFAVAYRAVFHGGAAESYMSLDRGEAPDVSNVNFGGRLQDTALGLVSLKSDIRFKTFSLGIDVALERDVREQLRKIDPGFKTHLERFAADPGSQGLMSQQTRLWFYPDAVDVTLSSQGDVLVLRRARMTAASERLGEGAQAPAAADPPWTKETVAAINSSYDTLARALPELGDLDQAARLLTLFTWLRRAGAAGHRLPDLDVLLDAPLPPVPTPRRFPQLLAYNALPPAGAQGVVDVIDRASVGAALERLRPEDGRSLPARRRLARAISMLDPRQNDHQAFLREVGSADPRSLDEDTADFLAYRAERLFMHHLVLHAVPASDRARLDEREKAEGRLRAFSVGIGGIDLGMDQAIDRALQGDARLSWAGDTAPGSAASAPADVGEGPPEATNVESAPSFEMPDHGIGSATGRTPAREFAHGWIREGTWSAAPDSGTFVQVVLGADGPEVTSRRTILGSDGRARAFERVEDLRFLRYGVERRAEGLAATPLSTGIGGTPAERAFDRPKAASEPAPGAPANLASLEVLGPKAAPGQTIDPDSEPAGAVLKLHDPGRPDREAAFPRALLERLLLGPELDLSAGKPLQGLTPPEQVLAGSRCLMVLVGSAAAGPPWLGPRPATPGEESPIRLAGAIERWWTADASAASKDAPAVVVGTDAARSPGRWERAPSKVRGVVLLLPEDAFPGPYSMLRADILKAWGDGATAADLHGAALPDLVVLASGEAPGLLGERLRALARDPRLRGKLVAVWPLGGPVRSDLPASLLEEGNLAGIGLADWTPVGVPRTVESIARLAKAVGAARPDRARAEEIAPELTWFY